MDRFQNVICLQLFGSREVGNGACDLEDTIVGPGVGEFLLLLASDHGESDGKIERRPLFFEISRSQIDGVNSINIIESRRQDGGRDAFSGLSHRGIGKSHDVDATSIATIGLPGRNFDLNLDGLDPAKRCAVYF